MRRLLLLIPVLFFLANCVVSTAILAQTKDNVENLVEVKEEIGDFGESKKIIYTGMWFRIGKDWRGNTINGRIIKHDDVIMFNISIFDKYLQDFFFGCKDTMIIKLTNSKIVKFTKLNDDDCYVNEKILFTPISREQISDPEINGLAFEKIIKDNLALLKQYDWKIIRLTGSDGNTDFKPNYSSVDEAWALRGEKLIEIQNPEQFFRQHLTAIDQK